MIARYHLRCRGCEDTFVARLGVEPTVGTRFYVPCPHCRLPIRGTMSGTELHEHRIQLDCELLDATIPETPTTRAITINPFVPSLYEANSFAESGAFPTMTLVQILGDDAFMNFEAERHRALDAGLTLWPPVRTLFQYYLQDNKAMFTRIARKYFDIDWEPSASHQRTTIAYQALGNVAAIIVGETGSHSSTVIGRFARKHIAAMNSNEAHLRVFRERGMLSAALERDLFTEINRFVEKHETWEMGLLLRHVDPDQKAAFDRLTLYRDEFSILRDLYQQGFELACKCIWPLVAAQNSVKHGHPGNFGSAHPGIVPVKKQARSLVQFDKLPNAYKIAYAAQVPGWGSLGDLLNSKHRNTIGHATAHHNLETGRVVSDVDPNGMTYLDFLGHTLGVFEALSTLAQVLRACRVASSPDFEVS